MAYGRKVARLIADIKPDAVISGNTPTEAQQSLIRRCRRDNIRFVYWLQDIYSLAVTKYLGRKLGWFGGTIGWCYQCWDQWQFRKSDAIVAISSDFVPVVKEWATTQVAVIENWAGIDDFPLGPKNNEWSRVHGLHNKFAFLYSGTLGRKHNPELLVKLAQTCKDDEIVVVAGQGHGLAQLHKLQAAHPIEALKLLPIQPATQLANVLTSADVLVATMEPDAGAFAVPSKVLSYLCTGRPILLAAPKANLAARIIDRANAGITVDPDDIDGFMAGAKRLREDGKLRATLGANGRAYAEHTFDMARITDQFESVLHG
jgi:glycosyltransferase involved in cell wall biosynthesis